MYACINGYSIAIITCLEYWLMGFWGLKDGIIHDGYRS